MKTDHTTSANERTLPRTKKHCHLIVSETMHTAVKMYANKHKISVFNATTRLLQQGLASELKQQGSNDAQKTRDLTKIRGLIEDLAEQSLK